MRYSKLLSTLQNLINVTPSQTQIAKILGLAQTSISGRAQRDSDFSEEELYKISGFYGVDLIGGDFNCIELDYIHIQPSCGTGTYVIDEAEITPVKIGKDLISNLWKSEPQNLKLFKATGDSMQPLIYSEDVVVVDVSKIDINNGGIFLLTINNEWYIKRLRKRITGELEIISENSKYSIEVLRPDAEIEISVKGKVIKNLSSLL